jgi:predicted protein tyrosine phosphatase
MKQIRALSKLHFDSNFTNERIKSNSDCCFISILDCDNTEEKYDKSLGNFIQIKIWDSEEGEKTPNDIELQKIVDFVNLNQDKKAFIVHCSAGVSRSGAVATFIRYKFIYDIDKEKFMRENRNIQPNLYILNRLMYMDNMI